MTITDFISSILGTGPRTASGGTYIGSGQSQLTLSATPQAQSPQRATQAQPQSQQRVSLQSKTVSFAPAMISGGGTPIQSTHLTNAAKAATNSVQAQSVDPYSGLTHLNLSPVSSGGKAGKNAAAVIAAELPVGHIGLAQQLGGGNPGLPEKGSLMYQDLVSRGIIAQGT